MDTKFLLGVVGGIVVGGIAGVFIGMQNAPQDTVVVEEDRAAVGYVLPDDAELIVPCIPGHGAHYGSPQDHDPDALWVGPTYIVDEMEGRVIGMEYHVSEEAFEQQNAEVLASLEPLVEGRITFSELELAEAMMLQFDAQNVPVKYVDLLWVPGHPGYGRPHYDVHLWTISKEEHSAVQCPPGA